MQYRYAETTVRIDIRVEQGFDESEVGRIVGVVLREFHLGLEVAAVVLRVRIQDYESNNPLKDVIVNELRQNQHVARAAMIGVSLPRCSSTAL